MQQDLYKKYGKVAVVMGGFCDEREISLLSGNQVLQSLINSGVDAHKFDPQLDPYIKLATSGYQRVVIMLHGKNGEDGTLQGMLECLRIPYTGAGVLASSIAIDKYRTKLLWEHFAIPMARHVYLQQHRFDFATCQLEVQAKLKLPLMVKPVSGGSTIAMSKVYDYSTLEKAINLAFTRDYEVLIEELIIGDEYSITVADGGVVYPPVKIEAPQGNYDYQNKYFTDDTRYICPCELAPDLLLLIEEYVRLCYFAIAASGIVRVDFLVEQQSNKLYFLEINTIPGMTSHSLTPMSFKAAGVDFDQLCLQILDTATLHNVLR